MTDRNNRNIPKECKDIDGILPIRKEAWMLQQPLPSSPRNQLSPNAGLNFSTPREFYSQQKPEGYPVQNRSQNSSGSVYGVSSPVQSTLPFGQSQPTHLDHFQHERGTPLMVPIFCYFIYCHQCQHYVSRNHQ